eukprot:905298-Rhodomonas_salina.1
MQRFQIDQRRIYMLLMETARCFGVQQWRDGVVAQGSTGLVHRWTDASIEPWIYRLMAVDEPASGFSNGFKLTDAALDHSTIARAQATPENVGKVTAYRFIWSPPGQPQAQSHSPSRPQFHNYKPGQYHIEVDTSSMVQAEDARGGGEASASMHLGGGVSGQPLSDLAPSVPPLPRELPLMTFARGHLSSAAVSCLRFPP